MTFAAQTHIGYVRDENQDRVEAIKLDGGILAVLCDGMGGEKSGSKASSMAMEVFMEHFREGYTEDMDAYGVRSLILSSVSAANSVVYTTARMDYQNFGMGTTCVAAFVTDTYTAIVNVGDSRAYWVQDGTMRQVTTDHNVVNMLFERGEITEEEMKTHPQRHMLVKAVGVERTVTPDYLRLTYEPGTDFRLMLCSDGLCGFCTDEQIAPLMMADLSAEEITKTLVDAALEQGGRDNISVAVVIAAHAEE